LNLLLVVEKPGKRIETLLPELAGVIEPVRRLLHRLRGESAAHHPALLLAPDEPGVLEDQQVLREARERHGKGTRELADRTAAGREQLHDPPAGRVGERGEDRVERLIRILNHKV
jgi:hypothetical protein